MTHTRTTHLPSDFILSEVVAFPFASEAGLALAPTTLDDGLGGGPEGNTRQLWTHCERSLARSFPGLTLDELVAIRDRSWFRGAEHPRGGHPLHRVLCSFASTLLRDDGHASRPWSADGLSANRGAPFSPLPPEIRARRLLRWLKFSLPQDLLIAASSPQSPLARCSLVSPGIESLLRDGFAEVHVHQGAALDFPFLWLNTLRRVSASGRHALRDHAFESAGAALDDGRDFLPWLLRATVAREVAARFLRWRTSGEGAGSGDLRYFLTQVFLPRVSAILGWHRETALQRILNELCNGPPRRGSWLRPSIVRGLIGELARAGGRPSPGRRPPATLTALLAQDAVAHLAPSPLQVEDVEIWLYSRGLRYLQSCEGSGGDEGFATLFWQMIRVRNLYYRHIVQRPLTPGLPWFVRFYGRLSPGKGGVSPRIRLDRTFDLYRAGGGLSSLELRTTPDPEATMVQAVRTLEAAGASRRGVSASPNLEVGLVFHLSRDRGAGMAQGHPTAFGAGSAADPTAMGQGYRFARYYRQQAREAGRLARLLTRRPELLRTIRGLDLCTDEAGIPMWVTAPLILYIRREANRGIGAYRQVTGISLKPLATTVHVGEDIVHLATALRRVHEAVTLLGLSAGDRLGHAIALGIDATKWAKSRGPILMPREDRLWDLVWEWSFCIQRSLDTPSARWALLEREIGRLSEMLFGRAYTPRELEVLRGELHSEANLIATGFPLRRVRGGNSRLRAFLTSPIIFRRGRALERIHPNEEASALETLQAALRSQIATRGLAVEINPSSNLLIGDLTDLQHHPLWRLRPPGQRSPEGGAGAPPLTVCIGSDDPITFSTTLPEEYQLLHDALIAGGLGADDAMRWLDDARRSGLRFRFTTSATTPRGPSIRGMSWTCTVRPPPGL